MQKFDVKQKRNSKSLHLTGSVKYLCIIEIDESLTWNAHINDIVIKLTQANVIIARVLGNRQSIQGICEY